MKKYAPTLKMAKKATEPMTMPAIPPEDRGSETPDFVAEPEEAPFDGWGVEEGEEPEDRVGVGVAVGVKAEEGEVVGEDPVEGVCEGVGVEVGVWDGLSDTVDEEEGDVPMVGEFVGEGEGVGVEVKEVTGGTVVEGEGVGVGVGDAKGVEDGVDD